MIAFCGSVCYAQTCLYVCLCEVASPHTTTLDKDFELVHKAWGTGAEDLVLTLRNSNREFITDAGCLMTESLRAMRFSCRSDRC